MHQPVVKD